MDVQLLTVPQVAETLGMSMWTVWRMVLDGRIASHKIGRSRRVAEADVRALLDASRQIDGRPLGLGVPTHKQHQARRLEREASRGSGGSRLRKRARQQVAA